MATTPYSLVLLIGGYLVAAAGVALLVRQLRRIHWRGIARSVRVCWTSPGLDRGLRTCAWAVLPAGFAAALASNGWLAGVDAGLGLVVVISAAGAWLAARVLAASLRRKTPRATDVARSARGPVASPTAGEWGGGATAVFPAVSAASSVGGGHRAGRVGTPLGSAGPPTVRLAGAPVTAPRRASTVAAVANPAAAVWVPGRGGSRGTRPGTTQRPTRPAYQPVPPAGWDTQTQVLAPIRDQHTEVRQRPTGLTAGR